MDVKAKDLPDGAVVASESRAWLKRSNKARQPWIEADAYATRISNREVDEMLELHTVQILRPAQQWLVRFSNYEPAEIDSIWPTESEANARVDVLDSQAGGRGMWQVEQWQ